MGHRSWLAEVKNFEDVRSCTEFIQNANEICGYETLAHIAVYLKYEGKLFIGWDSDGSHAGGVFVQKVLKLKRMFGLLGEPPFDDLEKFKFFKIGDFLAELEATADEKRWFKAARKITRP